MNFIDWTELGRWLVPLAFAGTVTVAAAMLVEPLLRPAFWRRTLWRATLLSMVLACAFQASGLAPAALQKFLRGAQKTTQKNSTSSALRETEFSSQPLLSSGSPATFVEPNRPIAPISISEPLKPRQTGILPAFTPIPVEHTVAQPSNEPAPPSQVSPRFEILWLGVSAFLCAGLMLARMALFILRRSQRPVRDADLLERIHALAGRVGLRGKVRLVECPRIGTPITFGILQPTIALPVNFQARFTRPQQEAILAHELAHLAARDPSWQCLANLAVALWWWHPLAWWARRRWLLASECAADEASVLVANGPETLAECLVTLARRLTQPSAVSWLGVEGGGFRSALGRRVARLMQLRSGSWTMPGRTRRVAAQAFGPILLLALAFAVSAWATPDRFKPHIAEDTVMKTIQHSWKQSVLAVSLAAVLGNAVEADEDNQPGPATVPVGKPAILQPSEADLVPAQNKPNPLAVAGAPPETLRPKPANGGESMHDSEPPAQADRGITPLVQFAGNLQTKLVDFLQQERELLTRFTSEAPRVKAIREQIHELERVMIRASEQDPENWEKALELLKLTADKAAIAQQPNPIQHLNELRKRKQELQQIYTDEHPTLRSVQQQILDAQAGQAQPGQMTPAKLPEKAVPSGNGEVNKSEARTAPVLGDLPVLGPVFQIEANTPQAASQNTPIPPAPSDPALAARYGLLQAAPTSTTPLAASKPTPETKSREKTDEGSARPIFQMDPALAARYGLRLDSFAQTIRTPTAAPQPAPATDSPEPAQDKPAEAGGEDPVFRMDPALLKRYGLMPPSGKIIVSGMRGMAAGNQVIPLKGRQAVRAKLESIVLDEVLFDAQTLGEVVRFLKEQAVTHDRARQGINFVIDPTQAPAVDPITGQPVSATRLDPNNLPVILHLQNVRLLDVLEALKVVSERRLHYSIEDYGVVIRLAEPPAVLLAGLTLKVDAETLKQGLQSAAGLDLDPARHPAGLTESQQLTELLRQFLTSIGVTLDSPSLIFYNARKGILLVRAPQNEQDLIQSAIELLSGQAAAGDKPRAATSPSAGSSELVTVNREIYDGESGEMGSKLKFQLKEGKELDVFDAIARSGDLPGSTNRTHVRLTRDEKVIPLEWEELKRKHNGSREERESILVRPGDVIDVRELPRSAAEALGGKVRPIPGNSKLGFDWFLGGDQPGVQTVSVIGAVRQPGPIKLEAGKSMDLFEAIVQAGDLSGNADKRKIILTRDGHSSTLGWEDLKRKHTGSPEEKESILLRPGDVIEVREKIF